jgi:uncharacterized protein YdaU (DUF1376 family)
VSKLPSMPLWVDSYLGDTSHLSAEEHGVYLLLLMAMWKRSGSVPDDDRDNARICHVSTRKWMRIKRRLAPFLIFQGGTISQGRLQREWNRTVEVCSQFSKKAHRSWEVRRQRNQILESSPRISPAHAPIPNININTSLQDAETPSPVAERLMNTGLMQGKTPFVPKTFRKRIYS